MPQTNPPKFGSAILQDSFENLSDQKTDVVSSLQDLVTNSDDSTGDSLEQLGGQKNDDPLKQIQQAQKQGLTPEQLAEKREEEKKKIEFYQTQVKGWEDHQLQAVQEEEQKKQQAEEEEKHQKEQGIIELREEEARSATLNPPQAQKPGRGTALLPYQAKSSMGTGELSKTPTN